MCDVSQKCRSSGTSNEAIYYNFWGTTGDSFTEGRKKVEKPTEEHSAYIGDRSV